MDNPHWNAFWVAKLAAMGSRGVECFHRPLRYHNKEVSLPDGSITTVSVGQEKGVDIRIALDVVRLARERAYDVAVIFSQDQDLSEVADEVKAISRDQGRWIKVACAFPIGSVANRRGINGTEWIRIEKGVYDLCIDPKKYGP